MHRINRAGLYAVLFLFAMMDAALIGKVPIMGGRPDLLIIFTIFFGLFYKKRIGLEVGLVCGFIKDILGIRLFGLNMLVFGLLGFACGSLSEKVYKENIITQFIIVFVSSAIIAKFNLLQAAYSGLLAPLVFLFFRFIFGHLFLSSQWRT